MTKQELIEKIAKAANISKASAGNIIDVTKDLARNYLITG